MRTKDLAKDVMGTARVVGREKLMRKELAKEVVGRKARVVAREKLMRAKELAKEVMGRTAKVVEKES
jgi:hypothetical protein